MTNGEVKAFLDENKIKLQKAENWQKNSINRYAGYVDGTQLEIFKTKKGVQNYVNRYKKTYNKTMSNYPYYELTDAGIEMLNCLDPKDFKVRIWGSFGDIEDSKECNAPAYDFHWSIDDVDTPIRKAWERMTSEIKVVGEVTATQVMQDIMNSIKVLGIQFSMGFNAWVIKNAKGDFGKLKVKYTRNVSGITTNENGDLVVHGGQSVAFIGGIKGDEDDRYTVTLFFRANNTGMKGEKPIPCVGVFNNSTKKYYTRDLQL